MNSEEKKTCSDWINSHPHTKKYIEILIERKTIAPAQADWIIKEIIIDERGNKYESDENDDIPAIDIWIDIQEIEGHYSKK